MDISTATTALKSKSAKRALEISPFRRPRPHASRGSREPGPARAFGTSPLRDPRRDLSMFQASSTVAPLRGAAGERLDPLLPPVISAPARRRTAVAVARASTARDDLVRAPRRITGERGAESPPLGQPAVTRRARLTTRGQVAVMSLVAGGIALCSAVTVGQGDPAPSVESTQVIARGGESVEGLAARAAQGRDVPTLAESIRLANGLAADELPTAGEVLVVPGS